MLYSAQTGGFYDPAINGNGIPADAVEITINEYADLIAGQSAGMVIVPDETGIPVLENKDPPSNNHLSDLARSRRNALLSACDWTMLADAPLTDPQKAAWADYRQDLRDVPDQESFPAVIVWPSEPA
jgi:hypothetical protein